MALPLVLQEIRSSWNGAPVRPEDAEDLAILLYAAYRGTIDDDGETFADATAEIDKTFANAYGPFLPNASFLIRGNEFIRSACLISWYEPTESPFVVFMMTRPEFKGQGMGRFLLQTAINHLLDAGHTTLSLIVTAGNTPAQRLYHALGFVPLETK